MDRFPRSDSIVQARSGLQTYMAQVYGWMTVGLLLTAFIAWYAANTPAVMMFVFSSKITFFGLIIAKGFILGLRLCVLLFLLNIMLCGTGLFDVLCHQNSELKSDLVIAIIMVVLCRWVMNGETFTMMIRFCLGRRLVRVALQKYLTSQTRK